MEGPLSKWTNVVQGWQYRWFVLDPVNSELVYYTSKDKMVKKMPRGRFNLKKAAMGVDDLDDSKFTLICEGDNKTFYFQAMDTLERSTWVREVEKVINSQYPDIPPSQTSSSAETLRQIQSDLSEGNKFVHDLSENITELRKVVTKVPQAPGLVSSMESQLMSITLLLISVERNINLLANFKQLEVVETFSLEPEFFDCNDDCFDDLTGEFSLNETVDEDFLYSADQKEGVEGAANESVIKHLIKQVQIGMDLTRITLPTHILERRSFLEMLADFFSHCDLFASITDVADPRGRMVEVVRAYLSCFHAGREGDVAKKPYNPILGEIFRSFWPLSDDSEPELNEGPVPWARRGDMVLLAEQVSHHPPVSAFFAENKRKRFSFEGQIWTKSKFLGLSAAVHMTGTTIITLEEHNETYTLSFPSGYARSILTVPWFELGGKVHISSSSGYSAQIEFHAKPTYKNTKNLISAQIFAPGETSQFCSIKGAWNGLMMASFGGESTQTFFDAGTANIVKKVVKPIRLQEPNESRRLWYDVTVCLFNGNVVGATGHKHALEEKQRSDKKYREENDLVYKPKYFELVKDTWKYIRHVE